MSPTKEDLVGLWVGFETSYPYFYRINLRKDDTGKMVVLFPQGDPSVYDLRWQFSERQLQLQTSPVTTNSEIITCSVVRVDSRRMDVVIAGKSNQWKRSAMLLNEKILAAGISESARHELKTAPK